jgi:hypothetical protein
MSLFHSPNVIRNNLLLNLDFKNPKVFVSLGTNLVSNPNYDPATWNTAFQGIRTPNIDAPDGSKTAVRLSGIIRTGTYTVTSNVATITIPNHGLTGGNQFFDFTSGTAPNGGYVVTPVNANTFTINITTANTSGNVTVRYRCGQRIDITSFTPNGTDTYTLSFWARLISLGTVGSTSFSADLHDGNPQITYTNQLIQDQWVSIIASGIPVNSARNFLDLVSDLQTDFIIDLWGVKLENQTADTSSIMVKDTVSNLNFNIYRPQYARQEIDCITFDRTTAPANKWGGLAFTTGTGSLTSTNFLYNDHTWEVWFKINDRNPEGTTNEGFSCLTNYRGYHSGFHYTASEMRYYIWNGTTANYPCFWSLGTSGTQLVQGQWYQIVTVRNGDIFTPYLNGVQSGNPVTFATPNGNPNTTGISNDIHIGAMSKTTPGASSFVYYSRNSIANIKMYNRALTASEIQQNFNALKGRFGI